MGRLAAIGLIWAGCAAAWWILGASLTARSSDTTSERGQEVYGLWGSPLWETAPSASYREEHVETETETVSRKGQAPVTTTKSRKVSRQVEVPLETSEIRADFTLDHRRRGLMWFATYEVAFDATYAFENPSETPRRVTTRLSLDPSTRTYDGLRIEDEGGNSIPFTISDGVVQWSQRFKAGERRPVQVSFRTRGTGSWTYAAAPSSGETRNFRLLVTTNFPDVDFPLNSVSPTQHEVTDGRWRGEWVFDSLITSSPIGLEMPEKLNPGPLAARITFFAPVSLLFFFFVISMLAITSERQLHPMHYFLLGCAFFAFHLLFAYTVDHIALVWAFVTSSIVSMFLVVSYTRLFVGWRFALSKVAPTQVIYLVLFSASFFWEGFTGLAITVGAIVTLFAMMQMTGRLDWAETFRRRAHPPTAQLLDAPGP